jgi:hypothetical protein
MEMATMTFDTLQFVQRLKKAGVQEKEAEAIAEAVRDAQANSEIATKRDLAELKADLVKWVVTVGVLQTAMIGALLMKLIPG